LREENSTARKKTGLRPTQAERQRKEIIMTNREFFEAIKNGTINEEVIEHATAEIDKMNARNEKRATTPSKTAVANEPIKAQILTFLTEKNEQILTSVVGEAVGISTAKASALLKQLADDGKIVGEEVKVPKIGKRMVWKIKAE
jgi:hypothetical protein